MHKQLREHSPTTPTASRKLRGKSFYYRPSGASPARNRQTCLIILTSQHRIGIPEAITFTRRPCAIICSTTQAFASGGPASHTWTDLSALHPSARGLADTRGWIHCCEMTPAPTARSLEAVIRYVQLAEFCTLKLFLFTFAQALCGLSARPGALALHSENAHKESVLFLSAS